MEYKQQNFSNGILKDALKDWLDPHSPNFINLQNFYWGDKLGRWLMIPKNTYVTIHAWFASYIESSKK